MASTSAVVFVKSLVSSYPDYTELVLDVSIRAVTVSSRVSDDLKNLENLKMSRNFEKNPESRGIFRKY